MRISSISLCLMYFSLTQASPEIYIPRIIIRKSLPVNSRLTYRCFSNHDAIWANRYYRAVQCY